MFFCRRGLFFWGNGGRLVEVVGLDLFSSLYYLWGLVLGSLDVDFKVFLEIFGYSTFGGTSRFLEVL